MKKLGLFYLSGTGNTKAITELFAKYYEKHGYACELYAIDALRKGAYGTVAYTDFDAIGIGSPIYGSNAVPMVEDFAAGLPKTDQPKVAFIFLTGADFVAINHGASYKMRHLLKQRGYKLILDKIYPMGSNWCYKYDDDMVWQLYLANERKINLDVQTMVEGRSQIDKKRWFPALCALFGKSERWGAKILSKGFAVNEKCIDCGKCIRDCPTQNISKKKETFVFGNRCLLCMKCIYYCPVSAIHLRKYRFMAVEGGYRFEDIKRNPQLKGHFLTEKTKGYNKHFYKYVKE